MENSISELKPSSWAMQRLGFSDRVSFLQFVKREGVPFYRVSARNFKFSPQEVEAWLEARRVGGPRGKASYAG